MEEELITTSELCKWLKISRATAYNWRIEGMPYVGNGRSIRYEKSKVWEWFTRKNPQISREVVA